MKHKFLRALCYLKELLAMLLCKLLGAVCRAFIPAYRGIWLVGERGTDARDNGYWFYRYLRTQHILQALVLETDVAGVAVRAPDSPSR